MALTKGANRGTKNYLDQILVLGGFVLLAVVGATANRRTLGSSELPNGRGGTNVEAVTYTDEMHFDKARSLKAFKTTIYPLLRANCSGCTAPKIKPVAALRLRCMRTST